MRSKRGSRRKKDGKGGESEQSPRGGGVRSGYEAAPQTRLIDENRVDEAVLSMVRCLYFGETFLGDGKSSYLCFFHQLWHDIHLNKKQRYKIGS